MLLIPIRNNLGKSIYLEQIGKFLKEDLNQASQKEDIVFIKQIIVPLLHAQDKASVKINFYYNELINSKVANKNISLNNIEDYS